MIIFAIDPGSKESGWVFFDTVSNGVMTCGKDANEDILTFIKDCAYQVILFEEPQSFVASPHVDQTLIWLGRFMQQVENTRTGIKVAYKTRQGVLKALFGKVIQARKGQPSRDSRVIALMKETYPPEARKGVTSDAWQALGLVTAYLKDNAQ